MMKKQQIEKKRAIRAAQKTSCDSSSSFIDEIKDKIKTYPVEKNFFYVS